MERTTTGVAAALLALTAAFSWSCGPGQPSNLLLITMDTTRADRLGCYGYERPTSPTLDRLARRGVVFREVVAQAAVTPVSHASILTGLNPPRHGLRALHGFEDLRLGDSARTLAQILGERGYTTAAFISAFPASSRYGLDRGFDHFDEDFLDRIEAPVIGEGGIVNTGTAQRRADATTDAAIRWLEESSGGPFFMWVHYFDPHDPYVLPPPPHLEHCGVQPGSRKEDLTALYDCEIHFMDAEIGRLVARVEYFRPGERSLIAVTADHGEGLGDHDWWSHGVLFQEQIRLPLILRLPGLPAGRVVPTRIRSIDIAPTLLDLLEIDPTAEDFDGESARAAIDRDGALSHLVAYSESRSLIHYAIPHAPGRFDRKDDELYGIIRDGWKLIHHRRRPQESELYHLERDPGETHNRFGAEPARARRLLALLEGQPGVFDAGVPTPVPADLEERLRALGYIAR